MLFAIYICVYKKKKAFPGEDMNTNSNIRKTILIASTLILLGVFGSTAWATISFVKPLDSTFSALDYQFSSPSLIADHQNTSRAPEPTTVALFGSGIFGLFIQFVRKSYDRLKRVFDVMSSFAGIVILSPFFLLTAILVKTTSKGPVFFTQTRVGKNGKNFEIFKFRTMHADAEKETGPIWARANDSRITPIGQFLRKSHIDEIPQFFNVLIGDMSLIGPRPERPVFVEKLKKEIHEYERRLEVKPGITGLAQVWHRYDETIEDVKKKIKYDLFYIRKMCLWTDFLILLRTVRVVCTGEGAR
jgi:exopolysaccharide biosynthesis polyprenyl glycosylphosphotransferase